MARFDGRCAVVTGAASGIGRATALRLASEGAKVLVVDVNARAAEETAAAIEAGGGVALPSPTDVTLPGAVTEMARLAEASFGDIRVLVNAAGVLRRTRAEEISAQEWSDVLAVNLTSVFLCCLAVYRSMARTGGGRIVNVASMAGRATSTLGGAHYTTAKAGVLGLTRHLAREWSGRGFTVNAISPGIVDTPMVIQATTPVELERIVGAIPTHRLGEPEEIAALIAFLASDEAAYITGTNVDIHGGELIIQ